jgi:hypothetical protein
MPEEKPGVIDRVRSAWRKFTSIGEKPKKKGKPVDTGRVSSRPVRPQPNEQQRRATEAARRRNRKPSESRSSGRRYSR